MKTIEYRLPSGGFIPGSPVAKMVTREYLVREEKGLFSSNKPLIKLVSLIGDTAEYAEDVNGAELDPRQIVVQDFLYADFSHALTQLRNISISPEFDFNIPCSKCKTPAPFSVILTPEGLDTVYLEEEDKIEFSDELSFGVLTGRHMLVKNSLSLEPLLSKRRQSEGKDYDGGFSIRLASQLVAVNDKKFLTTTDAERWLLDRTRSERSEITQFLQENSFGDDMSLTLECNDCGHTEEVMIPITDKEFLFREPRVENKRRRPDR